MSPNLHKTADLVTYTEEVLNARLPFLFSVNEMFRLIQTAPGFHLKEWLSQKGMHTPYQVVYSNLLRR